MIHLFYQCVMICRYFSDGDVLAMIDELDLSLVKQKLIKEYDELYALASISSDGAAVVELDQSKVGRLSRMDALQQQAMYIEQCRRRKERMLQIRRALQRLQTADYGWCLYCGEMIPVNRLKVNPAAESCTVCADKR